MKLGCDHADEMVVALGPLSWASTPPRSVRVLNRFRD